MAYMYIIGLSMHAKTQCTTYVEAATERVIVEVRAQSNVSLVAGTLHFAVYFNITS